MQCSAVSQGNIAVPNPRITSIMHQDTHITGL